MPPSVCTQASRNQLQASLKSRYKISELALNSVRSSLLSTIATGREQMHPQPEPQTSVVLLHSLFPDSRNTSKRSTQARFSAGNLF